MKKPRLPTTDSIQELAEFWDSHDSTDFESDLTAVKSPVFVRPTSIKIALEPKEVEAVRQMAKAQGISHAELIRMWVLQKISRPINSKMKKRVSKVRSA